MKRDNFTDHKSVTTQSSYKYENERIDLACAFRWTARLGMHEGVANHFSLAVNEEGTRFLMNPNLRYFSLIRASEILVLDANDSSTMEHPDAPDPTAWGLHASIHRQCPHARCVMHLHPVYSTVLASLADSNLPPIDQNSAIFYKRYVIDEEYGGLAFEKEGERCVEMLSDPKIKVMIMGNHGVLVIGSSVADTFNRLYYFERAAKTYIKALGTSKSLRVLSDEIAEKTAHEQENYPDYAEKHFAELKAILDAEEGSYRL